MSIHFNCPNCQAAHTAADLAAGRRIRCPACNALIEVPRPAEPVEADDSDSNMTPVAAAPPPSLQPEVGEPPAPEPALRADFGRKRSLPDGEMDMTPMVDVVFNLLIFFMVTATFAQQRSLEMPKPDSDQPSTQVMTIEDNPDYITVLVDEFNTFHVSTIDWERECAGEQELLVQLREALDGATGRAPSKLLVKANMDALHQYVVMALDAGSAVGIEEVQLVTVEEDL